MSDIQIIDAAASVDKIIDDCKKEIPPGTWGWLTLPGQLIRRRAHTSMQGGQLIYIDEAGAHWHKSLIDSSPRASFEPDEKLGPAGSVGSEIKSDDKDKEIALLKAANADVRRIALERDAALERCKLFDWIKDNVGNIDFAVNVPKDVFSSNPWIAMGHNFESAVAKARAALAKVIKKTESIAPHWRLAETAPKDSNIRVLAFFEGGGEPISGYLKNRQFFPDGVHGSSPFTHWMPIPTVSD